ncbi:MAG TPA: oxygen-dependent coproporphyrinogen oxidase [Paenirhodobacter sp.]
MTADPFTARKDMATQWFRSLRDSITTAFEALEDDFDSVTPPGRFEVTPTTRVGADGADQGGGLMSVMRGGRVFEKVGVNVSTVWGTLAPRAQAAMTARGVPGMDRDPRFWASGVSLVAHMQNPHTPAVHMNTRMFWTPGAWWFGGGADLNPCLEYPQDTAQFHAVLKGACDGFDAAYYPRFKAWADEYFHIPHRGRARGVGGIFYDDLNTGGSQADSWDHDFAFTRAVGQAFLPAFLPVTRRRLGAPATADDREAQLIHRGLYAEYNLVYDRGTKFGLETGHNADAVLMSLPPIAKWH